MVAVAIVIEPVREKVRLFYVWMAAACAVVTFGGFAAVTTALNSAARAAQWNSRLASVRRPLGANYRLTRINGRFQEASSRGQRSAVGRTETHD
jgi:hypothetical protein